MYTWQMKRATAASRVLFWTWTLLLIALPAFAQEQPTINDIVDNPGRYRDTVVENIEGVVTQHIESTTTDTKNYILQGDSGSEIRVKTTLQPPRIDARYRIEGLVSISFNREPVIIEQGRTDVSNTSTEGGAEEEEASSPGSVSEQLDLGIGFSSIVLLVLLGVVVIAGLGYFAYTSTQEDLDEEEEMTPTPAPENPSLSDTELGDGEAGADYADYDEASADYEEDPEVGPRIKSESSSSLDSGDEDGGPSTLKFQAPPKTMKFIPGKLVVTAGPDKGKEFRIAGHPTPNGNVVTIGRAEVAGDRAFSHIQLGETYRTVSRMQAEIIQEDQDIYLKNKSTTNPTMVNGEQVPPGDRVPLQSDDTIRMGELVLRYNLE